MCCFVYNQSTVAKSSPAGLVLQSSSSSALLPRAELLPPPEERGMLLSSNNSVSELSEGGVGVEERDRSERSLFTITFTLFRNYHTSNPHKFQATMRETHRGTSALKMGEVAGCGGHLGSSME
ncbi:hypothetical protein AOLI_G00050400 [Acnodon oligacanthus]